ncbi:response regulator [Deinococcus hopiensis]|uniref:Two component transcriptional regulator, LuxR family n=1 Tax=Deinococcus hopiensis KR-140 TaxID=695939 RepID=A0A1W1VGT6_9DEIO|nr:response regulator transcription factor [Deinococcus hopiensis]SMB92597.1 two component transcriptional regulator, LuxR family [Deinococcus hopiensis KR-140]
MTVRVLLVDDHDVVRQGLRMYLGLDDELEVIGEARNGQQAVTLVAADPPNVVIMDLLMPVMDGVTAIREIKRQHPEVEIIALTSALDDSKVIGAVEAGACGYLLKDASSNVLLEAIHAAARGEVRLHPEAARRLVREVRAPATQETLTPRETEILKRIARGHANKVIARDLEVSEPTVKAHVSSLLGKLAVTSRTQAALFALREGLVGLE